MSRGPRRTQAGGRGSADTASLKASRLQAPATPASPPAHFRGDYFHLMMGLVLFVY